MKVCETEVVEMVRVHPLAEAEQREVAELYRRTEDADLRSRCHMVLLSHQGLSARAVGRLVRVAGQTVINWIRRYEGEGVKGLYTRPRPGRPPRATAEYRDKLEKVVRVSPRVMGLDFSNWTTRNLAQYLGETSGIQLSRQRVGELLHELGLAVRRPKLRVTSPDPDYWQKRGR